MKHISRILILAAAVVAAASCSSAKKLTTANYDFPSADQGGKTAIVAHRGFWKSEAGGMSENSIASLKAAQDNGFWGSECDVHITADDIVIVNHDGTIGGKKIATHNYEDFAQDLLPNGEKRPTLDEYLVQAAKSRGTKLIIELKPQAKEEREDLLVEKVIAALKDHKLYDPERVLFISFSRHICEVIAAGHPQFINQFLSSEFTKDENPANYAARGINGVDYHFKMFVLHPAWVKTAHQLGMSVNAWTVNGKKDIQEMINLGLDAITTNEPLLTRELLGDKEFKN